MKLLITGGLGFIGSNLVDSLSKKNHKIKILTKTFSKKDNIKNSYHKIEIEKISSDSYEKYPVAEVRMMNQNVNPAVTAIDLKRGDENCNFKSDK